MFTSTFATLAANGLAKTCSSSISTHERRRSGGVSAWQGVGCGAMGRRSNRLYGSQDRGGRSHLGAGGRMGAQHRLEAVMPALTTLLLFALATFLLTVSPGPGVLYVVARSLSQGRKAGFASMFGIESGEVVWLAATATGLAALLATSAAALGVLRWAGAAYLFL